ncbi:MAG TPA: DUF4403 family protein [Planctomycetota bacterium]|nr:DUF4403 family protein [Planctomycetota bacterium]
MARFVARVCLGLLLCPAAFVIAADVEAPPPADVVELSAAPIRSPDLSLKRIGTVSFPVEISIDEVQSLLNDKAPESIDKDHEKQKMGSLIKDGWIDYHLERGTARLVPISTADGDVLGFDLPVSGKVVAGGKLFKFMPASVGLDFRGTITGSTRIALNPDWTPDVQVAFTVDFDKASLKLLHAFSFQVKDHLESELRKHGPDLQKKLLKQVDLLDIPKKMGPLWAQMHNTIRLSRNPPAWIQIKPTSIALAPLHYTPDRRVVMDVEVETEAVTFFGEKPPNQEVGPLPRLGKTKGAVNAFKVAAPSYITLSAVGDFLSKQFLPLRVDVNKDVNVTLKKLALDSDGTCVTCAVEAEAHGGLFGSGLPLTLHATTVPTLDAQKGELRFEKLRYTVDTEAYLAKTASALLEPVVLAKLQEKARFAFGELLEKSREKVNTIMVSKKASKNLEVNVHFDSMHVDDLIVLDGQVVIISDAEGQLALKLHP